MNIIFCRHGETEFNLFDRYQGISDSPLTEQGIEQARKLNAFLKRHFNVGAFYISPLPRVRQTYEIASEGISADLIVIPELRETSYGEWETKMRNEIAPELLEEKKNNRFTFAHPGEYQGIKGESYKDTFERITPFLEVLDNTEFERDVVVIAHQGVMVGVHKHYLDLSDEDAGNYHNSNHQVIVVSIENGVRMVEVRDLDVVA
jgi:probable phosphoglycerate mutase